MDCNKPPKILYTCCQPGYAGGTGRYVKILFEYFSRKYNAYLAVQDTSSLYSELINRYSEKVIAMDYPLKVKKPSQIIKSFIKLYKLLKEERFDIVHCNGKPDHKMVSLACDLLCNKPKVIYTQHEGNKVKTDYFTKKRFKNTSQVILTCDKYKKFYTNVGVKEESLTFIPNCVDTKYFSPDTFNYQEVLNLKKLYKIKSTDIVFISIGTPLYKGWRFLIQAMSRLQNNGNIKVILIGSIPEKYVIDTYITNLGLKDNVIFTGLQEDIRNYVALGDVGFMLSESETISFAVREMMALGKPVIVSDCACLPYNVDEGINGFVVPTGDIEKLKGLIEDIVRDKTKFVGMGLNARKKAEREFDIKYFCDETEKIYMKVLQSA